MSQNSSLEIRAVPSGHKQTFSISESKTMTRLYKYELQRLLDINNTAGVLLNEGNFEQAISVFGRALHFARHLMSQSQQERSEPALAAMILDRYMEQTVSRPAMDNSDSADKSIDTSEAFMYKRPLFVSGNLPCAYESQIFMSVVLIFNTALTYQMAADQLVKESLNNSLFVRKSIKLYRLAYNIYHEETFGSSPYFCMAIVNNLGLLYQKNRCSDKAEKCFQHLLSTLMFLVDCKENMEKFQGYFENTAHLIFKKEHSAASAA
jgi:tetratricopeptide (TPR) repeat protein